jgi:hypothetical protein
MTHFRGLLAGLRRVAPPANRWSDGVFVIIVSFVLASALSCRSKPSETQPIVSVTRPVGSWEGRGTATVGDVTSETGRIRITWQTSNESPAGAGAFKLTLRSAISGRTIGIVADHKGVGAGTAEYDEGPRTYDFLVESTNVDWTFKVEETSGERTKARRVP